MIFGPLLADLEFDRNVLNCSVNDHDSVYSVCLLSMFVWVSLLYLCTEYLEVCTVFLNQNVPELLFCTYS